MNYAGYSSNDTSKEMLIAMNKDSRELDEVVSSRVRDSTTESESDWGGKRRTIDDASISDGKRLNGRYLKESEPPTDKECERVKGK